MNWCCCRCKQDCRGEELTEPKKLLIYQSIYVPTLTYGHKLPVMIDDWWFSCQSVTLSLSLRDGVRSSAASCWKESDEVIQAPFLGCLHVVIFWRCPTGTPGHIRTWEHLGIPQEKLEDMTGKRYIWATLPKEWVYSRDYADTENIISAQAWMNQDKKQKMDGWIFIIQTFL